MRGESNFKSRKRIVEPIPLMFLGAFALKNAFGILGKWNF
jgi:hypothetical protein